MLFHRPSLHKAVERHLDPSKIADFPQKRAILAQWRSAIASAALQQSGEVALHGDFLIDIFARVLGYARQIESPAEWQLAHEQKTLTDATKADGALGFFTKEAQDIRAVIELKSVNVDLDAKQHHKHDKSTPVEQAFAYAHKSGEKCQWIIVSNYAEIRLYHASFSGKCETFRLLDLAQEEEFKRFYFLLAREFLLAKTGESAVETLRRQSQTAEKNITEEFYAKYSEARRHLFTHLKQQNPQHDDLTLLACTQRLLDRFIFIYFCEDAGDLLPEKTFRQLIQRTQASVSLSKHYGSQKIWFEMSAFFSAMDEGLSSHQIPGFNGELFKPDALIDSLRIEDDMLIELAALSDYDFRSDLNVNILGHIFEQSISDLEELRAEIRGETLDRKQGKRKKEGVFYTPEYVTRYIVEQAVGGWLAERRRELGEDDLPELTPEDDAWIASTAKKKPRNERIERHIAFWEAYLEQLKRITILDPACGSGAFLTQAFDFLMQEGEQVNRELNRLRRAEQLGLFSRKTWEKTVLRNNLFGVDLNGESVEITKLALWLKTAKKDDRLTALNDHIRCGNSLIDDPAVAGERAFDWAQAFPEIMQRGGFDVVIGNPPYVRQEVLGSSKAYFEKTYKTYHGMADLYVYFIEKGLSLLKSQGVFSVIVSNKWMRASYGYPLRLWLRQYCLEEIIDFGELPVFADAATFPSIIRISKTIPSTTLFSIKIKKLEFTDLSIYANGKRDVVNVSMLNDNAWSLVAEEEQLLLKKLEKAGIPLNEYVSGKIYRGIVTGCNEVFVIDKSTKERLLQEDSKNSEIIKSFIVGDDVRKYHIAFRERFLIFTRRGIDIKSYPTIEKYLKQFQDILMPKPKDWKGNTWKGRKEGMYEWYEIQDTIDYYTEFDIPKIIYPEIGKESRFTLDINGFYPADTTHIIPTSDLYLLGLLNSKLIFNYIKRIASVLGDEEMGGRLRWKKQYMSLLPIRPIDFSLSDDKIRHDIIVKDVNKLLDLNRQFHAATQKFTHFLDARYHPKTLSTKLLAFDALAFDEFLDELKKQKVTLSKQDEFDLLDLFDTNKAQIAALRREIEQTDRAIDALVYALYGLTDDEIRLVEGA
ncbi:Eco57I restriction endonuclease [Candidatus Moduliflexus flocculans]|uniref:site-specific DNA-methyltransferase (adenine-specific) n=1 Tax=Candidatus Moduliflexus flocculans TaxID=1499966 RepID=A0A081BR23_9BACT|nr:Eco57I restriction endonuclease [Candidatus Moduliflexus flocculans]